MIAETSVPTLMEDWQQRRAQLGAQVSEANDQTIALLRVLDYLIGRYEGTETARVPARTPPLSVLEVNTRAVVVHHHVWSGVVAGVKSRGQAQERMASVLHRMQESSHRRANSEDAFPPEPEDDMGEVPGITMPRALDREKTLRYAFAFHVGEIWAIKNCLAASPYLPEIAVVFLAKRASLASIRNPESVALLARCASPYVYDLAAKALGKRAEKVESDEVVEVLAALLRNPHVQELHYPGSVKAAGARLRERLASEDRAERLRTIKVLGLIGDLHDVGLLTDLAALCQGDDELVEEHAALVTAIDRISRRPDA